MKLTKITSLIYFMLVFVINTDVLALNLKADISVPQKLEGSFHSLCHSGKFSGVALVAIKGEIIFKQACGQADRSFGVKNNINTKFNLGSVGKLFTSIAIAQLIQEKKLSLNSSVYHLLPSWLPMKNGNFITIMHLLTHTSGLGNFMDDNRWKLGADSGLFIQTNDYKPLISEKKLLYKPGSSQSYSNSGYLLLGKVIEIISGRSYSQYVNTNVFNKTGMHDTGIYALDEVINNRAVGYDYSCSKGECHWKNNYFSAPFIGTAAGGAFSTVDDLFKFSQFIIKQKLLDANITQQILSSDVIKLNAKTYDKKLEIDNYPLDATFTEHGFAGVWNIFGFAVWDDPLLLGHTGGTSGASAMFLMSPDNSYTIIILSNESTGTIDLYKEFRHILNFLGEIKNL
jgi:CubicO group peptidase (beta-lactamase class C family)